MVPSLLLAAVLQPVSYQFIPWTYLAHPTTTWWVCLFMRLYSLIPSSCHCYCFGYSSYSWVFSSSYQFHFVSFLDYPTSSPYPTCTYHFALGNYLYTTDILPLLSWTKSLLLWTSQGVPEIPCCDSLTSWLRPWFYLVTFDFLCFYLRVHRLNVVFLILAFVLSTCTLEVKLQHLDLLAGLAAEVGYWSSWNPWVGVTIIQFPSSAWLFSFAGSR